MVGGARTRTGKVAEACDRQRPVSRTVTWRTTAWPLLSEVKETSVEPPPEMIEPFSMVQLTDSRLLIGSIAALPYPPFGQMSGTIVWMTGAAMLRMVTVSLLVAGQPSASFTVTETSSGCDESSAVKDMVCAAPPETIVPC